MAKSTLILALALGALALPCAEAAAAEAAFIKTDDEGDELLYIKLDSRQVRLLQKKHNVQQKVSRRNENHELQKTHKIELTASQRNAIRKALKLDKPIPRRFTLDVDFSKLHRDKAKKAVYSVRLVSAFRAGNSVDIAPKSPKEKREEKRKERQEKRKKKKGDKGEKKGEEKGGNAP